MDRKLQSSGREQVSAAYDIGDALICVVNNHCKLISDHAIAPLYYDVTLQIRIKADHAETAIDDVQCG